MTLAQTYSWIFCAICLASQKESVTYNQIEMVADGINHAIPTQKEMRSSISWLTSMGLIIKSGKKYSTTDKGRSLYETLSKGIGTIAGVWKNIEKHVSEQGIDNEVQLNPSNHV